MQKGLVFGGIAAGTSEEGVIVHVHGRARVCIQ